MYTHMRPLMCWRQASLVRGRLTLFGKWRMISLRFFKYTRAWSRMREGWKIAEWSVKIHQSARDLKQTCAETFIAYTRNQLGFLFFLVCWWSPAGTGNRWQTVAIREPSVSEWNCSYIRPETLFLIRGVESQSCVVVCSPLEMNTLHKSLDMTRRVKDLYTTTLTHHITIKQVT